MATVLSRASRVEISIAGLFIVSYLLMLPALLTAFCSAPEPYKPIAYNFSISGQAQENSAASGNKGAVAGPSIREIKATGSAQQQEQASHKPETWGRKFWCEINASDWFIGLFTLLLAIATYFLWRETERLAKGGDEQARRMVSGINATLAVADKTREVADAMQDSASAMRQLVGVNDAAMLEAKRSSRRELRAYLHATRALYAANTTEVEITFKNFGQTPAHNVRFWISAVIQNFEEPAPVFEQGDQIPLTSKGSVGPSFEFVSGKKFSGAAQQRVPPIRYYGKAFAFGKISYFDAFGKEWNTEFYFAAPWPSAGEMGTHTEHNVAT